MVKNDKLCSPVPARHSVANRRTAILFDVFLPGEDGPELGR
jgi:hypothetical protein